MTTGTQNKKGLRFLRGIFLIVLIFVTIGAVATVVSPNTQTPTKVSLEPVAEDYKASLAKIFCDNRSDGKPYLDLQSLKDNFESKPTQTTLKPTANACMGATNYCLRVWASKEDCENLANKNLWIGMTGLQLYISWGYPKDVNNTTNASGIHSQQVYGDFGPYVYLEGKTDSLNDLKVTGWQD